MISLLLFNDAAMVGFAHELQCIDGIHHAMYANDITTWATRGSLREKEHNLQQAVTCIEQHVQARGLACATKKSKFLRIWQHKPPQMAQKDPGYHLRVIIAGKQLPEKTINRILGNVHPVNSPCKPHPYPPSHYHPAGGPNDIQGRHSLPWYARGGHPETCTQPRG